MVVIYFVLIFGTIITIHELGHLIAAKHFNVYCDEFAFGMGPKIFSKKGKETTYSIRLFPIGGFVSMAGESEAQFDDKEIPAERTIKGIARWKRIIIMLAGVFMNFVLALVLFISINLMVRKVQLPSPPILSGVVENSVAEKAGFHEGDEILMVKYPKGDPVYPTDFGQIGMYFPLFKDQEITFLVNRGGEELTLKATPLYDEESDRYLLGVNGVAGEVIDLSVTEAIAAGFKDFKSSTGLIMDGFKFLFQGVGVNQLSGPIGIIDQTDQIMNNAETFNHSLRILLFLIATFSVNLGIVNLIPLPMFDGGRVLITSIEILLRRDINEKLETALMFGSFIIMIMLLLLTTYNDIIRIIFR